MKRFVPGQKIRRLPGGSLNMALDLVGKQGRFGPPPGPGDRPPTFDTPVLVVPCKNMSGVALPERAIVGVDVSAFTPPDITPGTPDSNDANEAILRGVPVEIVKPNATTHASKWGVTLGPMGTAAPDNVGHLVITGLVWARVNVTDAAHKCVALTTDDYTYLASAASGTAIWDRKLAGTGKQWALILLGGGGGGSEKHRLIRGQSYGAQSGATILLDNVVALAGGVDPSAGNPATLVTVYNLPGGSYADNEIVEAAYNPGVSVSPPADWEALKTGTGGTEKYRLIRGQCVGGVAADATSFKIDNIVVLSGGLDPRAVAGDMAEQLWITNSQKETFVDDEYVCAIYFDTGFGTGWQTLLTERPRAIRGTWYSGQTTLMVKNVVPLCGGLDPRTSPGNAEEIVSVTNTPQDAYHEGDKVYADWDATSEVWEARPKGSGITRIMFMHYGAVTGASATAGPAITPTILNVEKLEWDEALGKHKPSGEHIDVEYCEGDDLPSPGGGRVYIGEAIQIGGGRPYIVVIYCKTRAINGGA